VGLFCKKTAGAKHFWFCKGVVRPKAMGIHTISEAKAA
jgi:hypothetical protein